MSQLAEVTLDDKFARETGRIYLNGTQALVRLLLMQRARDRAAGWNTAGYVTGYRGSPLGALDMQLWRAAPFLTRADITFQPGLNEDLAATALWGTQQLGLFPGARVEGVFGLWYGKAPGVDRSGDALRHANLTGTSARGGVLVLAGDDHGAKSSTVACHSEFALIDLALATFYPASIAELIEFGLYGWALSRLTANWVAMKILPELTDCAGVIEAALPDCALHLPPAVELPPSGLHVRWPDTALAQEERLHRYRLPALRACLAAYPLDRVTLAPRGRATLVLVAAGKTYLDVRQALDLLDLGERAGDCGIALYKVAVVWPFEPKALCALASADATLFVIEEKRAVLEPQIKAALYDLPVAQRPRVIGKCDEFGAPLLPDHGELSPQVIALAIAERLARVGAGAVVSTALARLRAARMRGDAAATVERVPHFCAGCPHNSSTRVPQGSRALAGIGCHFMAQWMDRETATFTHMGGEGASWIGQAPFTETRHVFVNIGDGTYTHSGSLAIRAAVIAGINVTYKILYNDAVAMTGGQPVDGQAPVARLTHQLYGEGVQRIAIVTDEPARYAACDVLASGVSVHAREMLDAVQRELREIAGVTVVIYDQTCASEKRRRRKRGRLAEPARRVFINEHVCEGCGDCGLQSNCLAIAPLETEFGRKRRIDQSSCNKDYRCLDGLCPSFVTVTGGRLRSATVQPAATPFVLAEPERPALPRAASYNILVTGVGGTGVVTIGNLLGMAAHLEGRAVSVLDQTGLAQKYGAVMSHVRVATHDDALHAARLGEGEADLVLGADLVTCASSDGLRKFTPGRTRVVADSETAVVSGFTRERDLDFGQATMLDAVRQAVGEDGLEIIAANALARSELGDSLGANLLLVGYAYQRGWLPQSAAAIERAIEINGAAVEFNVRAFRRGRQLALEPRQQLVPEHSLADKIALRAQFLTAYQDAAYAARYTARVARMQAAEARARPGTDSAASVFAESYFHLLAYKDEYEVARLHTASGFVERLRGSFEGRPRLYFHLAPPLWAKVDAHSGRPRKRAYGAWIIPLLRLLAAMRRVRGTVFDPFSYLPERRLERTLIAEFEAVADEVTAGLAAHNHARAVELLRLPLTVRGYGMVKTAAAHTYRSQLGQCQATWRAVEPLRETA